MANSFIAKIKVSKTIDHQLEKAAKSAAIFLDFDLAELCEVNLNADLNCKDVERLLITIYESLHQIMGGHQAEMRNWMVSENAHLQKGRPKDLMPLPGGLVNIANYLTRFRSSIISQRPSNLK